MLARIALVMTLAVAAIYAQRGGGRGRGSESMSSGEMRPQRQSKMQQFTEKLKLSREQVDQVRTILSAAVESTGSLAPELEKSRVEIAGAMIDGKSPDDVKRLAEAYAELRSKIDFIEADAFAKIVATLKPNQQAKAGQAFELMTGLFETAASSGARRGR